MTNKCLTLAVHGGAGPLRGRDYKAEVAHMRGLIEAGRDRLIDGASALEVVVEIVVQLEASGLYVAGRGASPNTEGVYELDASLMDGSTGRAGIFTRSCTGVIASTCFSTVEILLSNSVVTPRSIPLYRGHASRNWSARLTTI